MTDDVSSGAGVFENDLGIDLPERCGEISVVHMLEGARNFRELVVPATKPLRRGRLFRSGGLSELSDKDVARLEELGIRTIVDLRSPEEIEEEPNRRIGTVESVLNLPIGIDPADIAKLMEPEVAAQLRKLWAAGLLDETDALLAAAEIDLDALRKDRYRDFALKFAPQIGRFMKLLVDPESFPLVVHCQGGKDRTGFASGVVLLALGYSESDVVRDYLVTNLYRFESFSASIRRAPSSLRPALGAHRGQIRASLRAIEAKYESFRTYRLHALDLSDDDIGRIAANLLDG